MGGVVGSMQAMEAIKFLTGAGKLLTGTMLTYDALSMKFRSVPLPARPDCAVCGPSPSILRPFDYAANVCEGIEI
jgi:molybdopterin/thiamine biosynthesis adenylyltransferase